MNYNKEKHETYVSPPFSSVVYRQEDVQAAFFLMILLVILGEFFSSPAITLADSVSLRMMINTIMDVIDIFIIIIILMTISF